MKYLLFLCLISCGADRDLEMLVSKRSDCKDFKNKIDQSKISEDAFTEDMKIKVKSCKSKEFWD